MSNINLAGADWILFTSSSTVKNTAKAVGLDALGKIKIASIGPVTSATVRSLALEVAFEASEYTVDGLLSALVRYAGK
jgi:uroporphyrinogen III methyltransferase/synthase